MIHCWLHLWHFEVGPVTFFNACRIVCHWLSRHWLLLLKRCTCIPVRFFDQSIAPSAERENCFYLDHKCFLLATFNSVHLHCKLSTCKFQAKALRYNVHQWGHFLSVRWRGESESNIPGGSGYNASLIVQHLSKLLVARMMVQHHKWGLIFIT